MLLFVVIATDLGACLYFSKSMFKLEKNRLNKKYDRFDMKELKGATMGIVGYGDIGQSCAKGTYFDAGFYLCL